MKILNSNTEEKILEAAKEVFMKYGLYGARMQDIADKAGMNKALLHYYFRNKEKLFDQVFEGALSKYFQQLEVFSDKSKSVHSRIHQYVDNIIDFLSEYPQMSMFIIKEISINPELFRLKVMSLKKDKSTNLVSVLKEGMENGEIDTIDPVIFMMNLHSLCAYPFLASPIFKAIVSNIDLEWKDNQNQKLKESVKDFIDFKLRKTSN
jgi:TetR/AcrR family transcriptional regulator